MNKINLARKISVVHAAKCAKSALSEVATASSKTLSSLMLELNNSDDTNKLTELNDKINVWACANPIVLDHEITELMNLVKK